jgi:PAS domain S-box-containing protein
VGPEPGAGAPPFRRASVLVASSDSATRDLLRRVLNVGAVELVDASDGVEAMALARRLDLDLIVLDAFLAVMDGISVCSRIRALREIDQPPIIMVGLSSERAVEAALAAGADETLPKPLNPSLIRYRTRVLLVRRKDEQRMRLMERALDAAPAGVTLLDARSSEYSVTLANPAFQRLTGYPAGEIVGRNLRLLVGPDTDMAAMTQLREAMAAGRPARVLLKNQRKDGQPFWNDLATAPILDSAGRLTHYVAVQHDVTPLVETPEHDAARATEAAVTARTREVESALARVEARRHFTESILNSMVSAILATDVKGNVTFANLAALRILGTSLADCVGRSVVELFGHHESVAEVVSGSVPPHPEYRLDFSMISPGGARFYVGMSISPAPPEFRDEIGFIVLFRDLAETIDAESDLQFKRLAAEQEALLAPEAETVGATTTETAEPAPKIAGEGEATPGGAAEGEAGSPGAPRRMVLALRYASPADLARAAIGDLAERHEADGQFVSLETGDDVPEVLLDRQQVTEALTILLSNVLDRCEDPANVRVRVTRTEAASEKGGPAAAAARIEILYPRILAITEQDLAAEAEPSEGRTQRRTDFVAAEKLLEANGGRLIPPLRNAEEQALTIILRAAR